MKYGLPRQIVKQLGALRGLYFFAQRFPLETKIVLTSSL